MSLQWNSACGDVASPEEQEGKVGTWDGFPQEVMWRSWELQALQGAGLAEGQL